jgi:hypothetical protein
MMQEFWPGGPRHHASGRGICSPCAFATREEKIELLEEYRQMIESDLARVKERIERLKKEA